MTKKKQTPFEKNRSEIKWNLINSGLVGVIAFTSSLITEFTTTGKFSLISLGIGLLTAISVFAIKFCDYWGSQKSEYENKLLTLI